MNWIERMYEIKDKDLYSQNGEGLYLEYISHSLNIPDKHILDIGAGDGFILSNSRHLVNLGWTRRMIDKYYGHFLTLENLPMYVKSIPGILSIDIDGNDYWILNNLFENSFYPPVVIAEFNSSFTDSRAIVYNPDHVWVGDDYYGFSFDAGVRLADKHGYKIIYQIADMNIIMVREDLINGLTIPEVTFNKSDYFKKSERKDWIII